MVGDRGATLILLLTLCSLLVTLPNIELVRSSEPPFLIIEPNDVHVSYWDAPPDAITEPTTIIIVSPENRTYATGNLSVTVNVGVQRIIKDGANTHYIRAVWIKADWVEINEQFYHLTSYGGVWYLMPPTISFALDLTGIPEGNHNLTVYASDSYDIVTTSTVYFTIDSSSIPEFPSWTPLLITLVAMVAVAVIYKRRLLKNQGRTDK
jgi:hypothetical protein